MTTTTPKPIARFATFDGRVDVDRIGDGSYYTAQLAYFTRRYGNGRVGRWFAARDAAAATRDAMVAARRPVPGAVGRELRRIGSPLAG